MKHSILLKRFEYSIPGSDTDNNGMDSRDNHPFEMYLPQVKVSIDFEKRSLFLEGNGSLMMTSTRNPDLTIAAFDKERIRVKATIHPGFTVDLSDSTNNGLVFSLEGILDDGKDINSCSGLLVLDNMTKRNEPGGKEWWLTIYLYDDYDDEREIKLRLTMCSVSENAQLN